MTATCVNTTGRQHPKKTCEECITWYQLIQHLTIYKVAVHISAVKFPTELISVIQKVGGKEENHPFVYLWVSLPLSLFMRSQVFLCTHGFPFFTRVSCSTEKSPQRFDLCTKHLIKTRVLIFTRKNTFSDSLWQTN